MASRYLNQRIIWNKIVMADTVENIMRNMVFENAISPDDSSRIIPNLELGDETTVIVLNTKGVVVDVDDELKRLLDYIGGEKPSDEYLNR